MKGWLLLWCCMAVGCVAQQVKEPKFPGGQCKLNRYMRNIPYPYDAIKSEVEGTVYIQFTIDSLGRVQQARIKEGVHPLVDTVALRHIEAMPDWRPGHRQGRPANFSMVIPISFGLSELSDKRIAKALDAFEQGKSLYYVGAYDEALPYLARAIRLDPHFAEAFFVRGMCHYRLDIAIGACLDLTKAQTMGYYEPLLEKTLNKLDCEKVLNGI